MINAADGELQFDDSLRAGPHTAPAQLKQSIRQKPGFSELNNPPYLQFRWLQELADGPTFRAAALFRDSRLSEVLLCAEDPAFGASWGTWSEDGESARRAFHDQWLCRVFDSRPPPYRFRWGRIDSTYDGNAGASIIRIRYSEAARPD